MFATSNKVRVMIPTFKTVTNQDDGKNYTVYCIEVIHNGKIVQVERRYSEFYDIYRKLQKIIDRKISFPPKRVLNKDGKLLETRRKGLQFYLQAVLHLFQDDIPERLLNFLELRDFYDEEIEDNTLDDSDDLDESYQVPQTNQHQRMICFKKDVYLHPTSEEREEERRLPCIVMKGCLDGIYRT
ncbi:sorting nexin-24-like [Hydractinia symbiolongicarpus]|uniref:sorting nexin-24-like n=1 Tax=Hydractinia symbiolongicarpus TaxID=13093 RepID=UPI00254E768A|nr:sorting nexin-24-like [Hydractinia symbiolongicarpus]